MAQKSHVLFASLLLLAALVAATFVGTTASAARADGPGSASVTLSIQGGMLTFQIGTPILLDVQQVNAPTRAVTFALPVTLTDATGTGNGWHLDMGCSTTVHAFLFIESVQVQTVPNSTSSFPVSTGNATTPLTISTTSTQVLSALPNTGMGQFALTLRVVAFVPTSETISAGICPLVLSLSSGS